jgi:hypothetical protein
LSGRLRTLSGRLENCGAGPIWVTFQPELSAYGGRLYSGAEIGVGIHGGAYLRRRRLVVDRLLLEQPGELARILVHEIGHFVWLRLGNQLRRSFEDLVLRELEQRARGELGWSSELRKVTISRVDIRYQTRNWRNYLCESFCDTLAWRYCGLRKHDEFTLSMRYRRWRREWLEQSLPGLLRV